MNEWTRFLVLVSVSSAPSLNPDAFRPSCPPISPYEHPVTTVNIGGLVDLYDSLFPLYFFKLASSCFSLRSYLSQNLWAFFRVVALICITWCLANDWLNEWMNEWLDSSQFLSSTGPWLLWRVAWPWERLTGTNSRELCLLPSDHWINAVAGTSGITIPSYYKWRSETLKKVQPPTRTYCVAHETVLNVMWQPP